MTEITIPSRFNGPADSGNGGYVGGLLAAHVEAPGAAVSLRLPPPLDAPLTINRDSGKTHLKTSDGTLVAEAEAAEVSLTPPPCPDWDEVMSAQPGYAGFAFHALPTCFVCGPGRAEGDGMRIFASPLDGQEFVAAPWVPDEAFAEGGEVRPEFIWAALDCPGYFAVIHAMRSKGEKILTGRMAVGQRAPVHPGQQHIIVGWQIGSEGRKHWAGTAIYGPGDELCAVSEALWIKPRAA